jgi:ADP-ribose pyrophosphatase YjhB (NUDIX family)
MNRPEKNAAHINWRVAAVILHENHILLQGEPDGEFWTLPSGSVELLESTEKALKREIREELEVDIRIERLLWVAEEFFMAGDMTGDEMVGDRSYHQLGFYYLVTPIARWYFFDLDGTIHLPDEDGSIEIIFRWFDLDNLQDIILYPTFLADALRKLPTTIEHKVLVDDDFPVLSIVPVFPSNNSLN